MPSSNAIGQTIALLLIIVIIVAALGGYLAGSIGTQPPASTSPIQPSTVTTTSTVFQNTTTTAYQNQQAGSATVTWTQYQTNVVDQNDSLSGLLVSNLTLGGFPDSIGINEKTNTVYVEYATNTTSLAVINGNTDSLRATIPLGGLTQSTPIVNSNTNSVYIGNVVINGTTNKVIQYFNQSMTFIAANPILNAVYAMNSTFNGKNGTTTIFEINGNTNSISSSISFTGVPQAGDNSIAMNENTGVIYLTVCTTYCGFSEQYLIGVGTTSSGMQIVSQIPLNELVFNIAVNSKTNMIYLTALQNLLVVINGTSEQIAEQIPITAYANELRGISVDPSGNEIFLAGGPDCQGFSSCGASILYVVSSQNYGTFATFDASSPFILQFDPVNNQTYILYYFSHFVAAVSIPHYTATFLIP